MPRATRDRSELVVLVRAALPEETMGLIGIDGWLGSGKTTLAQWLGNEIGATVVSLDDFIDPWRHRNHLQRIKIPDLCSAVSQAGPLAIVEGICLLQVAKAASLSLELIVYVKRLTKLGDWGEEDLCTQTPATVEDLVESVDRESREFEQEFGLSDDQPEDPRTPLFHDAARYHATFSPVQQADFIYERAESSSV